MEKELVTLLRRHEGVRLKPYRDTAGKLTIGIGRNLDDVGISNAEADALLSNDISTACLELDRMLPWWRGMNAVRRSVLASMSFNLGMPRLLKFQNALEAMKQGLWPAAADEMLDSRWATQVGDRAKELANMMETGTWPEWMEVD